MDEPMILASGSPIRAEMLRAARVSFEVIHPRVDEESIKQALHAEGANPRDIADALAEAKARKVATKHPDKLVIGADQVLQFKNSTFSKPKSKVNALDQLLTLRGKPHHLLSAAVVYHEAKPVWRHVSKATLYMRDASDDWLSGYLERNWNSVQYSVGAYKIEEEGVRLFSRINGDNFTIMGMPLLELLSYLTMRGSLPK